MIKSRDKRYSSCCQKCIQHLPQNIHVYDTPVRNFIVLFERRHEIKVYHPVAFEITYRKCTVFDTQCADTRIYRTMLDILQMNLLHNVGDTL